MHKYRCIFESNENKFCTPHISQFECQLNLEKGRTVSIPVYNLFVKKRTSKYSYEKLNRHNTVLWVCHYYTLRKRFERGLVLVSLVPPTPAAVTADSIIVVVVVTSGSGSGGKAFFTPLPVFLIAFSFVFVVDVRVVVMVAAVGVAVDSLVISPLILFNDDDDDEDDDDASICSSTIICCCSSLSP